MIESYACNVENPNLEGKEDAKNYGCGTIFESEEPLGPRDRLCPSCSKKHAKELAALHAIQDAFNG